MAGFASQLQPQFVLLEQDRADGEVVRHDRLP
jgi:hypothetical protein